MENPEDLTHHSVFSPFRLLARGTLRGSKQYTQRRPVCATFVDAGKAEKPDDVQAPSS